VKDYVELTYLTKEEGGLLGLPEGSAVLLLTQQFYSGDTQVMYMRSIKNPERFKFLIELERKT